MTPERARQLIGVGEDVSAEELDGTFRRQTDGMKAKIDRAPTPSLKAKYVQTLSEMEEAWELLSGEGEEDGTFPYIAPVKPKVTIAKEPASLRIPPVVEPSVKQEMPSVAEPPLQQEVSTKPSILPPPVRSNKTLSLVFIGGYIVSFLVVSFLLFKLFGSNASQQIQQFSAVTGQATQTDQANIEKVSAFLHDFFRACGEDGEATYYAELVDYFDEGSIGRSQVTSIINTYNAGHPVRSFVPVSINVEPVNAGGAYRAICVVDYQVSDGTTASSGQVTDEILVGNFDAGNLDTGLGGMKIVKIKELKRQ